MSERPGLYYLRGGPWSGRTVPHDEVQNNGTIWHDRLDGRVVFYRLSWAAPLRAHGDARVLDYWFTEGDR